MNINFYRLRNFITQGTKWLWQMQVIWAFLLLLVGPFIYIHCVETPTAVNVAAFSLTAMGTLSTVLGLLEIRKYFGRLTIREILRNWWKAKPQWKGNNVIAAAAGASMQASGMLGFAQVWSPDIPTAIVEDRIAAIIANQERMREEQGRILQQLHSQAAELERSRTEQAAARVEMERTIRNELTYLHTEGIPMTVLGLFWLLIGSFLSGFPEVAIKLL
jgi:hypothetical protein